MTSHVTPLPHHPQLEIVRTDVSSNPREQVVEYRVHHTPWKDGGLGQTVLGDLAWVSGLFALYRWLELDSAGFLFWKEWSIKVSLRRMCQIGW